MLTDYHLHCKLLPTYYEYVDDIYYSTCGGIKFLPSTIWPKEIIGFDINTKQPISKIGEDNCVLCVRCTDGKFYTYNKGQRVDADCYYAYECLVLNKNVKQICVKNCSDVVFIYIGEYKTFIMKSGIINLYQEAQTSLFSYIPFVNYSKMLSVIKELPPSKIMNGISCCQCRIKKNIPMSKLYRGAICIECLGLCTAFFDVMFEKYITLRKCLMQDVSKVVLSVMFISYYPPFVRDTF